MVVPAAGRGTRFGNAENKIWAVVAGRTVLEWTLSAFQSHPVVDAIVIAGAAGELNRLRATALGFAKVLSVVEGGSTRQESVANGLNALPQNCDIVLVHDAARPAISQDLISRVIREVVRSGAAVPGVPISDSVKRADTDNRIQETVNRVGLWTVQTPQGVRAATLRDAYDQLGARVAEMTDEAGILEAAGVPVRLVEGETSNIKVTTPGDLEQVGAILCSGKRRNLADVRTGIGYDVHAFESGRPLWLGGVEIPHGRGLAGHSDADVVLHAVCDALLGAAGLGDIGVLFPDTDSAHKDRASIEFVREVKRRLEQDSWITSNVDIALLAEEPRVGPYREEMVSVISVALGIEFGRVNLKATTAEKMGFVGRKEGVACWATATLIRGER